MMRCGTRPCSARTATGFWTAKLPAKFMTGVLNLPQVRGLLSSEHFSVDGTLIEAWASMKSFVPKDGRKPPAPGGGAQWRARLPWREAHPTTPTLPRPTPTPGCSARVKARRPSCATWATCMTENRHGLIVDAKLTEATGTAEREAALAMIDDNAGPGSTLGADKNYDTAAFVAGCREQGCVPHVAQNNKRRRSAIDARTTRHPGYRTSQISRKRIEEPFGWMKTVGGMRKTRHCGRKLVEWFFVLTAAAYNLVRIRNILAAVG